MQENTSSPSPDNHGGGRLKRSVKWIAGGFVVLILLAVLLGPMLVRAILRYEIQSAVATNLNATLEIDDLSWKPLLSVAIGHARLVTPGPDGTPIPVAELAGLQVSLAKIPTGGPIIVENFTLLDPVIDLVRLPSGEYQIQQNLVRPHPQTASTSPSKKPSDMIQVRHFAINNLTVRVQDWKSTSPPQVIAKVDVQSDLATAPGKYDFHFALVNQPVTDLKFDGSVDLDGTSISLKNFVMNAQVPDENGLSALPPQIAALCRQYRLAGSGVAVSVADGVTAAVDMDKKHWTLRGLQGDLKLTSAPGTELASGRIVYNIVAGGPLPSAAAPLGLDYLKVLDPDTLIVASADPQGQVKFSSPSLPFPITDGVGALQYSAGTLSIKGVRAHYGPQPIRLDTAAAVTADQLKLQGFKLVVAGGTVVIENAGVGLSAPHAYTADITYKQIQLSDVAKLGQIKDPGGHLTGVADGTLNVSGTLPAGTSPLKAAQGKGDLQVQKADFFDIPFLAAVVGRVIPDLNGIGRVGDAAAVYTFADGKATFSKMNVSCPLVGIQGTGDVGMLGDNPLDLKLTISPLGDLKKQLDQTGIPILGQAFGDAQKALTKVQNVLYGFHVTGPAANPKIDAIAAPGLTGASKDMFGTVLKGVQGATGGQSGNDGGGIFDFLHPPNKKK